MKKLLLCLSLFCASNQTYGLEYTTLPTRLSVISKELETNFGISKSATSNCLPLILGFLSSKAITIIHEDFNQKTFLDTACSTLTAASLNMAISCYLVNQDDHAFKMLLVTGGFISLFILGRTTGY